MTWIHRAEPEPTPAHTCEPPMREMVYRLPALPPPSGGRQGKQSPPPKIWRTTVPAGEYGALWRCEECRTLWRVGDDCDDCDAGGVHRGGRCVRGGYHPRGTQWRPARWWQRIRYRNTARLWRAR